MSVVYDGKSTRPFLMQIAWNMSQSHLRVGKSTAEQAWRSRPFVPLPKHGDVEVIDQRRFDPISITQEYVVHVNIVVDQRHRGRGSVRSDVAFGGGGPGVVGDAIGVRGAIRRIDGACSTRVIACASIIEVVARGIPRIDRVNVSDPVR